MGPDPIAALVEIVKTMPRTKVVTVESDYLHTEFRTRIGFVDDVEFLVADGVTHVRSASRIGYGDHGVNRDRINGIRERIHGGKQDK